MLAYIVRRLLLIIPTLLGIMVINFVIIQAAPGGPVEQMIARAPGRPTCRPTARFGGRQGEMAEGRGARRQSGSGAEQVSRRARPRPGVHQGAREAVRLRQAGVTNASC